MKKNERRHIVSSGLKVVFFLTLIIALLHPNSGICRNISNAEIMNELKTLKARVNELEEKLNKKTQEIENLKEKTAERAHEAGIIDTDKFAGGILDRITIGGLLEVGAVYDSTHNIDGTDQDSSDVNLTTVEIGVGIKINDWVNVETVFLYEDANRGLWF